MSKWFKKAFSLVELMVTLIIISIIVSAMTPAITKKLKSQAVTVGSGGGKQNIEFQQDCSAFGESCALCFEAKCTLCTKICEDNEYVSTPDCSCKSCNNFDENCTECNSKNCKKCKNGYGLSHYKTCEKCKNATYSDGTFECLECEAGYFCKNGIKTQCAIGSWSNPNSSECTLCSINTEFCKTCETITGACLTCDDGYEISGNACISSIFDYTYTGVYQEGLSTTGAQKIFLKTSGIFTPTVNRNATLFLVGGGGGGGDCENAGGGGGGYTLQSTFALKANTDYTVTIGSGGSAGRNGKTTSFSTNKQAFGGDAGNAYNGGSGTGTGGMGGSYPESGGAGIEFDGSWYGGGGGGGGGMQGRTGGAGGKGGGGAGGYLDDYDGSNGATNTGGGGGGGGGCDSRCGKSATGGSGIAILIIE